MSQTKAQLVSGTTAQDLTVDNINTTSINSGQTSGRKNLIINGAMQIAQRGTSVAATSGYKTVDRFKLDYSGADNGLDQSQHTLTSSDTGPYAEGFRKSYHITNGNQTSGAGAADFARIAYTIEAQDIATSGWDYTNPNSFITLSYWIKSSIAYTTYINISTSDGTVQNFTATGIALSADTWKKVSVTIPGNANLQFDDNANAGLLLSFIMFYGTNFTTSGHTLNTWSAAGDYSDQLPDMVSTWWTTNDSTYEITGVQLEVGSTASDFEHRPFADELALCQRYFTAIDADGSIDNYAPLGIGRFYNSTLAQVLINLPTTMRQPPTIEASSTTAADTFAMNSGGDFTAHALNSISLNERSFNAVTLTLGSGTISGQTTGMSTTLYAHDTDVAKLGLTAEL